MRALDYRSHGAKPSYWRSGGKLPHSLTPAQRLALMILMIRQRRLKAEFLRRDGRL